MDEDISGGGVISVLKCSCEGTQLVNTTCNHDQGSNENQALIINKDWNRRLVSLQQQAIFFQHQLAYLSTLGGAHHVCKKPKVAFMMALRCEAIGQYLRAPSIIVQARIHQAYNLVALGQNKMARKLLKCTRDVASGRPIDANMLVLGWSQCGLIGAKDSSMNSIALSRPMDSTDISVENTPSAISEDQAKLNSRVVDPS
jgi:hypothetical protein